MVIATASRIGLLALIGSFALATSALADQVAREQDIVNLRLGQRILVDDGSCPAGQIKQVSRAQVRAQGVVRVSKCIAPVRPKK